MEVQRLNKNSIRLYLTAYDVQNHGYELDEVLNKDINLELFTKVMSQIDSEFDIFNSSGYLQVVVHVVSGGIEFIATLIPTNQEDFFGSVTPESLNQWEEFFPPAPLIDQAMSIYEQMRKEQQLYGQTSLEGIKACDCKQDEICSSCARSYEDVDKPELVEPKPILTKFKDIEQLIQLANRLKVSGLAQQLYFYENKYYLYTEFAYSDEFYLWTTLELDRIQSILLEYGEKTPITIHRLEEYGKVIMPENALITIREHFLK
jgi:adapter protein MecA 1/2